MARFKNRWDLENAFFKGELEEGHTGSKCSNYATDFKKDWKYKFVNNILYDNGKPSIILQRDLKLGISFDEYMGSSKCHYELRGYTIIRVLDCYNSRAYIHPEDNSIRTFINNFMYCAISHLMSCWFDVQNAIEKGRSTTIYAWYSYTNAVKEYQTIRTLCSKKFKASNIHPTWYYIKEVFRTLRYRGFNQVWNDIPFEGYVNRAMFRRKLDIFDEFILTTKIVYYSNCKNYTKYCKTIESYPYYREMCYTNPKILYEDLKAIYDNSIADPSAKYWYYFKNFHQQILNKICKWDKDTFKKN